MYENPEVCAECGGDCCKKAGGGTFPDDFGPDIEEGVRKALSSGDWAIDWWEGPLDEASSPYFIRPRHKDEPQVHPSWGGECVFLKDDGCQLEPEDRPTACRELEPSPEGDCVSHLGHTKKAAAKAWIPYQDFLQDMVETLE